MPSPTRVPVCASQLSVSARTQSASRTARARPAVVAASVVWSACASGCATSPETADPWVTPAPTSTARGAEGGAPPWPTGTNPPGSIPGGDGVDAADGDPGSAEAGTPDNDASAPPPPAPGCTGAATWKPGDERTIALTHGGVARSYLVHVGRAVAPGKAAPLVVNVHGLNNSPAIQVAFSGMSALADTRGLVVAYPQGLSASFNAGGCCGQSASSGVDDLGFIRDLVTDVEKQVCVDTRRVYATGFSNGGYMAYRLGCEAADVFAAIAPVSGANASPTCKPGRPVPVFAFHGDADPIVSYATDKTSVAEWVTRDGCKGAPTHTTFGASACDEWAGCDGGVKVKMCTIAGGSHLWPGAGSAVVASPAILDFFDQFALP
jgi:polyhydroxybutyrate depolymerase